MIKAVHHPHGGSVPILVCDVCGKRILEAGDGAVLTVSHPIPEGAESKVLHVHQTACYAVAENNLGHKLGHEEVWRHLLYLLYSLGLSPEKLQAYSPAVPAGNAVNWVAMPKAA